MGTKRKAETVAAASSPSKRRITGDIKTAFRSDLFEPTTVESFNKAYTTSGPYPHAIVSGLIQEQLLRDVRSEITENIHFTLKETDIYRIHQSGDLANLSNLDQESLKRLPSLVRLRDALYSKDFREWVSQVTGAGKVSGNKTDMAVNVYTPGSYLLCHDDVIGSRRVSYILYLTNPDEPWQAEWGGGLRLYPTEVKTSREGEEIKVPLAEWSKTIPPSFSQLSFFAVRPGESYHDVEEVYHATGKNAATEDRKRIRMAVSGWFHIPQEGEDGFEEGVEQAQAQRSTLAQLQAGNDEFDEPQTIFKHYDEPREVVNAQADGEEEDPGDLDDQDETILTEQDLTFLLQYIAPGFLVPDKLEELSESFEDTSMLQLESFLAAKFAEPLEEFIENADKDGKSLGWPLARPPHKHRFAYLQEDSIESDSLMAQLLKDLLHSHAFKKWLAMATGLRPASLTKQHALARRFRRGHDYALANTYTGQMPRLEFTINLTPSTGWDRAEADEATENGQVSRKGKSNPNGSTNGASNGNPMVDHEPPEFGGEEVYMAADEDDGHDKALPSVGKKAAHDPAVYQSGDGDDDGGILFSNAPGWNTFTVVLRDSGTMRFVKYVSRAAKGDRWDVKGEVELADDAFDGEDDEGLGEVEEDDVEEEIEFEPDDDEEDAEDDDSSSNDDGVAAEV